MPERRPPPLPAPFGLIAEPFYRVAVGWRNRGFDSGRRVTRLPVPVVSVGNISVGGTGKTPMVMRIVEWLLGAGRRPVIAMRGYGARPGAASDEEAEYRGRFQDVPIVAQADRLGGLRPVLAGKKADCVVLDDGFQHRFIARDLDIVLIDATRSPFDDRCLPAGWLREPVGSLRRAGVVVVTHAEAVSESEISHLTSHISDLVPRVPIFVARHEWSGIRVATRAEASVREVSEPVEWFHGRPVVAASGIGNPGAFIAGLESAGARVLGAVARRDHHEWTRADVDEVRGRLRGVADAVVVTTEKDWVKLKRLSLSGLVVARPVLAMGLGKDEERFAQRIMQTVPAPY